MSRWMPVNGCRSFSEGRARIAHLNPRGRARVGAREGKLRDDGDCAAPDCLRDEPVRVQLFAANSDEDRFRRTRARIVRHVARFAVKPPRRSNRVYFISQVSELQILFLTFSLKTTVN